MLQKNFYKEVEKIGKLKHILYGDSVSSECKSIVQFKGENACQYMTFNMIWNKLINDFGANIIHSGRKEYLFIQDEIYTLAYDVKTDKLTLQIPKYLMRHYVKDELIKLNLTNEQSLTVTKQHSMLDYDPINRQLITCLPSHSSYIPIIRNQTIYSNSIDSKQCQQPTLKSTYYGKGTSPKKGNQQITRKRSLAHLYNIKPAKIQSKENIHYEGYVYDFEVPNYHNFTANGCLVHNTDSIFILVPANTKELSPEQKWEIAEKSADEINNLINKYVTGHLLPRCNINPKYNQTYFKTELLMDSGMFLNVKKQYAYKLLVKEGVVLDPPKVKYTGIQVVKSDAAKMTQNMLKEMIEKVVLNSEYPDNQKLQQITMVVNRFKTNFNKQLKEFDFTEIGLPGKWGKKALFVHGMTLYNKITNQEIFGVGSAGKFTYCKFVNPPALPKDVSLKDTKGICIPYEYNVEQLRTLLEKFGIVPDGEVQWNKLFTTTCQRVVDLVKTLKK